MEYRIISLLLVIAVFLILYLIGRYALNTIDGIFKYKNQRHY